MIWEDGSFEEFDGDSLGFLKRSASAEQAVTQLLKMAFYRDISIYGRMEVPFLKRAQILLQDMKIAEPNHALLQFDDFDELTIFADNVIPFVLKADRVLKYNEWLEGRIQNEELIGSGSFEEIEIRACSVYAVETLCEVMRTDLMEISVRELDYCLWNRGQELKKITDNKRHRTRCVYY